MELSPVSNQAEADSTAPRSVGRPRLQLSKSEETVAPKEPAALKEPVGAKGEQAVGKRKHAWEKIAKTEEYVDFVGEFMYPKKTFKAYGFDADNGRFPINRVSTLGYLLNPLRRVSSFEMWSPYEVAIFESSMYLYGKNFTILQKYVKTKSVKEIIEFYYDWKNTSHYRKWKKTYLPDDRIVPILIPDK